MYHQAHIPTEQQDILQIVVPQSHILQVCQIIHITSRHARVDCTEHKSGGTFIAARKGAASLPQMYGLHLALGQPRTDGPSVLHRLGTL